MDEIMVTINCAIIKCPSDEAKSLNDWGGFLMDKQQLRQLYLIVGM